MSTTTLTERYVHEVVRRIPADQREDVADELRATIADTVEARAAADPALAEREVLTEMGDPIRLAARYAERPLALIGSDLYPTYIRLLRMLLSTVLPVVVVATVVVDVIENDDIGSAIGAVIGAVITVGAQMIAWLTLIFALLERLGVGDDVGSGPWTPDNLREVRRPDKGGAAACAAVVWNTFLIGLIIWQYAAEPYRPDGSDRMAVLDPALWSGWIWPILAGLAGVVVLEVARIAMRGWNLPLAASYAVAEAVFALPLAWVLYQQEFFNPAFLAEVNASWTAPDWVYTLAALGVLAVSAGEVFKRFREARR